MSKEKEKINKKINKNSSLLKDEPDFMRKEKKKEKSKDKFDNFSLKKNEMNEVRPSTSKKSKKYDISDSVQQNSKMDFSLKDKSNERASKSPDYFDWKHFQLSSVPVLDDSYLTDDILFPNPF